MAGKAAKIIVSERQQVLRPGLQQKRFFSGLFGRADNLKEKALQLLRFLFPLILELLDRTSAAEAAL